MTRLALRLWYRLLAALGLAALLAACSPAPRPHPIPAPEPSPPGACAAAAARLEKLQCREDGVELWVGFSEACETSEQDGSDWNAEHIACVESCGQVEAAWRGEWRCPE